MPRLGAPPPGPSVVGPGSQSARRLRKGVVGGRGLAFRSLLFGLWAAAHVAYLSWSFGAGMAAIFSFSIGLTVGLIWAIVEGVLLGPLGIWRGFRKLVIQIGIGSLPIFFLELGWSFFVLLPTVGSVLALAKTALFVMAVNSGACFDPAHPERLARTLDCQRALNQGLGYTCGFLAVIAPIVIFAAILHWRGMQAIRSALAYDQRNPGLAADAFDLATAAREDIERRAFWFIIDTTLIPLLVFLLIFNFLAAGADGATVRAFASRPADTGAALVTAFNLITLIPLLIWRLIAFARLVREMMSP